MDERKSVFQDEESAALHEYLTFTLGSEEYAIDILNVQEIRGYEMPTKIANTPEFIKGVINLRGVIVPIIDLRIKFAVPKVEYLPTTVVIVLSVLGRVVGMVVDSVSDVLALSGADIRPAPQFSSLVSTQFVLGLASVDERMLIVTDIEKIIRDPEMALIDDAVSVGT